MSYFVSIPSDITTNSILRYIEPFQIDKYCLSDYKLHQWCLNPDNIEYYLKLLSLDNFTIDINKGLIWAIEQNSSMLVNYFLFKGANNYDEALAESAYIGNSQIINQILTTANEDLTVEGYNKAMMYAAQKCHTNIVKQMLTLGARNYGDTLTHGAIHGCLEIVRLMIPFNNKFIFNYALRYAAERGYLDIVQLLVDNGADEYNDSIVTAAQYGHIDIVKLMINLAILSGTLRRNIYNNVLYDAAMNEHPEIVKLMLELGATNAFSVMFHARKAAHLQMADLIENFIEQSG